MPIKIFSLPSEIPAPKVNYNKYNFEEVRANEKKHMAELKTFLIENGCTGKHTGEIYFESVGDGHACYMVADAPRSFGLVHLPYGDSYQARNVGFLTKTEIIKRIERAKQFREMFAPKT